MVGLILHGVRYISMGLVQLDVLAMVYFNSPLSSSLLSSSPHHWVWVTVIEFESLALNSNPHRWIQVAAFELKSPPLSWGLHILILVVACLSFPSSPSLSSLLRIWWGSVEGQRKTEGWKWATTDVVAWFHDAPTGLPLPESPLAPPSQFHIPPCVKPCPHGLTFISLPTGGISAVVVVVLMSISSWHCGCRFWHCCMVPNHSVGLVLLLLESLLLMVVLSPGRCGGVSYVTSSLLSRCWDLLWLRRYRLKFRQYLDSQSEKLRRDPQE